MCEKLLIPAADGSEPRMRCLIFSPTVTGEVWTDGSPVIFAPPPRDPIVFSSNCDPERLLPRPPIYCPLTFRQVMLSRVPVYVADGHEEEASVELREISYVLERLPPDLFADGFWLARSLWLLSRSVHKRLLPFELEETMRRQRRRFRRGIQIVSNTFMPPDQFHLIVIRKP